MKHFILTSIFLLLSTLFANGQYNKISNGAYRNFMDFNKNNPFYTCKFEFKFEDNSKIPKLYKIESSNKKIKKKTLKYEIKLIKLDSSIYLNGVRLGMVNGYIKIHPIKTYCYFKGIPLLSIEQQNRLSNASYSFGLVGGTIESSKIKKENKNNIHYVLNLKSGLTNLLTKEYILRILHTEPKYSMLLEKYKNEVSNETYEVCRKYLELVNQEITN